MSLVDIVRSGLSWLQQHWTQAVPASAIFGWVVAWMLRPRLRLDHRQDLCREIVATVAGGTQVGRAVYLRLWIYNRSTWNHAKEVQVFVNEIIHEGRVVEQQRSECQWKDVEDREERFAPKTIHRGGIKSGRYVDICSKGENQEFVVVQTRKGQRGYFLRAPGAYTFDVSVEGGPVLASQARAKVTIVWDGAGWDDLTICCVQSARSRNPFDY